MRNSIHEVEAEVVQSQDLGADQYLLRLQAPTIAAQATPGSFVHMEALPERIALRRPFSVLWRDRDAGTVDVLYKVVGAGTEAMAHMQAGAHTRLLGPIGRGFDAAQAGEYPLLVGGGVGIPPILFLARQLQGEAQPFVVMGSEVPFPFPSRPSQIRVPGIPEGVIAGMDLLEDLGIASRLCSLQGYAGCHNGYVDDLARHWLAAQDPERRARINVFACGPMAMLEAVARLAREFDLRCQVCVEEYMACAVGGCAGCTIPVMGEDNQLSMKRVCVDGPVFDARGVFHSD